MRDETLYNLAEQIRRCTACPLWKKRTLAVPGEGPASAKIMFIGEAPGAEEDRIGKPFVGRSGKFLNELLEVAGIKRDKVFVTGMVKCRPPKNRNPTVQELKTCKRLWLDKQIEVIQPRLVVVLGNIALKSLLGNSSKKKFKIKDLHGKVIERNNLKYFITYHPAAGMRFPKIKELMIKDFKTLRLLKSRVWDRKTNLTSKDCAITE